MMGEHARLSPSGSHRWIPCPGSLVLESAFPNESNEHSDRGTACHWVSAQSLTLDGVEPVDYVGEKIAVHRNYDEPERFVEFDEELADFATVYVTNIRKMAEGHDLAVEQRVDFSEYVGIPDQFGTLDARIMRVADKELQIHDLKSGRVFVEVENNTQLMLYALGAYGELSLAYDIDSVRLFIHQPPLRAEPSEWLVSVEDLLTFGKQAYGSAQTYTGAQQTAPENIAQRMADAQPLTKADEEWARIYLHQNPNEDDCSYCRAKATCVAAQRKVREAVGADFEDVRDLVDADLGPRVQDTMAEAKKAVPFIRAWCDAVDDRVSAMLKEGKEVSGFKLVLGRAGNRAWVNPEEVEVTLRKQFRLRVEEAYNLKLISPTQAEKLTKGKSAVIGARQWLKLQSSIVRSDPKPSVAPESDPRPAVAVTPAEDMFTPTVDDGSDLT